MIPVKIQAVCLSRWFIVPGIVGLLTLVVTTIVTGLSVAREREAGTFDQLLVTPMRPVEILIGKFQHRENAATRHTTRAYGDDFFQTKSFFL